MPENFKYFTIGVPADHEQPLYGIYQPVLDCFLVVHHDLQALKLVNALLTSRYSVFVVCVSGAKNYTPTLIDNHVCHQWTLSNPMDLSITNYLKNLPLKSVDKLIEAKFGIAWDLNQERRWALMCLFYVTLTNKYKESLRHSEVDQILCEFVDVDDISYARTTILKDIFKILYFGRDEEKAEEEIISVINKVTELEISYQDHLEKYQ
jgi:hypothetical protein